MMTLAAAIKAGVVCTAVLGGLVSCHLPDARQTPIWCMADGCRSGVTFARWYATHRAGLIASAFGQSGELSK